MAISQNLFNINGNNDDHNNNNDDNNEILGLGSSLSLVCCIYTETESILDFELLSGEDNFVLSTTVSRIGFARGTDATVQEESRV